MAPYPMITSPSQLFEVLRHRLGARPLPAVMFDREGYCPVTSDGNTSDLHVQVTHQSVVATQTVREAGLCD